jgi:hypothetical protein
MRNVLAALTILLIVPGCAAIQDWQYKSANSLRSECAWARCAKNPLWIVCPSDYGTGWKRGYACVAMGGSGHVPTLPPKKYWSPMYLSANGQQAVAAWNAGFQDGAVAALHAGAGQFHYLGANRMPVACHDNSGSGFPPHEVVPGSGSPAGASGLPYEPPPETLLPYGNGGAGGPAFDGASSARSVPNSYMTGLGHMESPPPSGPMFEPLPP